MTRRRQTFASGMRPIHSGSGNEWIVNYEPVGHPPELSVPRVAWRGQTPIVERFWSRVDKNGPVHPDLETRCWQWTGCVVARYGQISLGHPSTPGSKRWKTHRFSWELHNGPIPDGLKVCHACDNPRVPGAGDVVVRSATAAAVEDGRVLIETIPMGDYLLIRMGLRRPDGSVVWQERLVPRVER